MSQTKVKSGLVEDNSINASKLDVTGNGTSGQVLLSDGDGTFSWADRLESLNYETQVISINTNAVKDTVYVLTADLTLTLPASPVSGDSIKISNLSGVQTCVLGSNGNNIMATSGDLTLDDASKSFELIYTDATNGWVIIG